MHLKIAAFAPVPQWKVENFGKDATPCYVNQNEIKNCCPFYSLLYPQRLGKCLAYNRHSTNTEHNWLMTMYPVWVRQLCFISEWEKFFQQKGAKKRSLQNNSPLVDILPRSTFLHKDLFLRLRASHRDLWLSPSMKGLGYDKMQKKAKQERVHAS